MNLTKKTKGLYPIDPPLIQQEHNHSPTPTPTDEEDYDYDLSIYEEEEKEEVALNTLEDIKANKPRITNLKSKYGNSIQELESLQGIKAEITKYAIKVGSDTEESKDLWMLYSCLGEYWSKIKEIFGTDLQKDIEKLQKEAYELLKKHANRNEQNYLINEKLLKLRDEIYLISQRAGLGLEVEKIHSFRSEARRGIVE